ncbi:unnamed protein product, partial [Laminaria digitata]
IAGDLLNITIHYTVKMCTWYHIVGFCHVVDRALCPAESNRDYRLLCVRTYYCMHYIRSPCTRGFTSGPVVSDQSVWLSIANLPAHSVMLKRTNAANLPVKSRLHL